MPRDFFGGAFRDCLVGKADLKEELGAFVPAWGCRRSVDDFASIWFEMNSTVDSRVVGTIHTLRRCGVLCCLASNQEKHRAEYAVAEMEFGDVFDRLFFSCDLGYTKPGHSFYESVANSVHTEGQSVLFWDDSLLNVEAARDYGWHAEVYTGFEDFEVKLDADLGCAGAAA